MNGHFSAVGEKLAPGSYEHGVQVVDEEKDFKYVHVHVPVPVPILRLLCIPFVYVATSCHSIHHAVFMTTCAP